MKLPSWHEREGNSVEWYSRVERYDCAYIGRVFTFTPGDLCVIQANEVAKGGSGYKMYDQTLPDEVEHICLDYSLCPMYNGAHRFLTRGCVNQCSFYIVPREEDFIWKHTDVTEFLSRCQSVTLMDNNIIASDWGLNQTEEIVSLSVKVDFNQGLDRRIITKDKSTAHLLSHVGWRRFLRMTYDNSAITDEVTTAITYLREAGIPGYKLFFYTLVEDGQIKDAEKRALYLNSLGCILFAMPYGGLDSNQPPTNDQKHFARWVNKRPTFKSYMFENFKD